MPSRHFVCHKKERASPLTPTNGGARYCAAKIFAALEARDEGQLRVPAQAQAPAAKRQCSTDGAAVTPGLAHLVSSRRPLQGRARGSLPAHSSSTPHRSILERYWMGVSPNPTAVRGSPGVSLCSNGSGCHEGFDHRPASWL